MSYIDGVVAAVPRANRDRFIEHARWVGAIFKEYGAQKITDCWGDDVPEGKLTSFPMAVKCEPDETVVFSWILWPSREVRDQSWEKIMADPRMQPGANPMPFDGKRMIFGGFEVVLDL